MTRGKLEREEGEGGKREGGGRETGGRKKEIVIVSRLADEREDKSEDS